MEDPILGVFYFIGSWLPAWSCCAGPVEVSFVGVVALPPEVVEQLLQVVVVGRLEEVWKKQGRPLNGSFPLPLTLALEVKSGVDLTRVTEGIYRGMIQVDY